MKFVPFILAAFLSWVSFSATASEHDRAVCESQMGLRAPVEVDRAALFNDLADVIDSSHGELAAILSEVDTPSGAEYEIRQAARTLRGAIAHELKYLESARTIENVAVYGSTNIPLYTLVLHAFIPSSVSRHVWFRTPAVSRQTYVRLFEHVRSRLARPDRLDGIHLLTDPRDVQYDNFRKTHVLGLHRNGKRQLRAPSELVIFTGNPQTGRRIFEVNAQRIAGLSLEHAPYEQRFLLFGSGMNPVVVTGDSSERIRQAVDQFSAFIRINSSQDCIAPNFSLVHRSARARLLETLLRDFKSLVPGRDYGSLVFSEDTAALLAYRDSYRNYLVNPEARIDSSTRLVEPHVFLFPIEMWSQVALEQHYAPFVVLFEYRRGSDLQQVVSDPRVLRQVMFASVFGETAHTETRAAIEAFQRTGHDVFINQNVFAEEDGNRPFGGVGPDTSSVLMLRVESDGLMVITEQARPLLFSIEAGNL